MVITLLAIIQAMYGQQADTPRVTSYAFFPAEDGTGFHISATTTLGIDKVQVRFRFEGTINNQPIDFKQFDRIVVMNDGKLSDTEIQLIILGTDVIKSALNSSKLEETPGVSMKYKAEGRSLQVNVESQRGGGVKFQGQFFAFIDERPAGDVRHIEFKSDSDGNIILNILNEGALSAHEIAAVKGGADILNQLLQFK